MKKHPLQHDESMFYGAPPGMFLRAKRLRENMTEAEKVLWEKLRMKRFHNLKFRRQHPIGLYIVDFYCHSAKLIIEADGEYHLSTEQRKPDKERAENLNNLGLKLIRFTNKEILNNISRVMKNLELVVGL